MTTTLELPSLTGSRRRARYLVDQAGDDHSLRGASVILDCRQLVAGTESFVDELIKIVLVDRGAEHLTVDNADGDFAGWVCAAARDHGVSDRVTIS